MTPKEHQKKFNLTITAHVGNDFMVIYTRDYFFNLTEFMSERPVHALLSYIMPFAKWMLDDGDDKNGTDYCQYVSYENNNPDGNNYLLGAWTEVGK